MLKYAIISINLALFFYTIGVWGEKWQRTLKKWHIVVFWIGLFFDTTGTTLMSKIASGGFQLNFHGITGALAIIVMLFHATWATVVFTKNNENMKGKFHKFSILVRLIWLVPFISGAIFAMV